MRRAPTTLWFLLLGELSQLMLIIGAAVVGVIAFAASVKPLADGQVGLVDAARIMGLLVVPMLQFALPFAAGLGATLTYHRFATENESLAALAAGVSYRRLLMPAMAAGLTLAILLAALSNVIIPRFLHRAAAIVTRDSPRAIIMPLVDRGQPIPLRGLTIHAEQAFEVPPDEASGELTHVILTDVFAVQQPEGGAGGVEAGLPESIYLTASQVDVSLYAVADATGADALAIQLTFQDADGRLPRGRIAGQTVRLRPIVVPANILDDDPKFLSVRELRAAWDAPRRLNVVESRARRLVAVAAEQAAALDLETALARAAVTLVRPPDERYTLQHAVTAVRTGNAIAFPEGLRVEAVLPASLGRTLIAESASLTTSGFDDETGEPSGRVTAMLDLEGVTIRTGAPVDARRATQTIAGLAPPTDRTGALMGLSADRLVAEARAIARDDRVDAGAIERHAREVERRVAKLRNEILAKVNERAAYAIASALMVLTGAVMALRLRDALPLPVYLWSFAPALLTVITISAGQGMTHAQGPSGLFLLWGGVVGLGAFTYAQYRVLVRH